MNMEPDYFAEGADAALAGAPETANPYDLDTEEAAHLSWNDGWASIHDEGASDAD